MLMMLTLPCGWKMLVAASARDAVSAGVHVETVVTVRSLNTLAADTHDAVLAAGCLPGCGVNCRS